ncbi:KTSC domain-containing protein [Salinivibrio proteolyticus]|uniref:KTSC domain-containing protein n=2 Tax=Salinivibrio TaxID=51366 RepID=A0ABY7LC57_9GAMM|nr:KTSC domain-containing protein [Salinivibrio proteolyticus]WBA14823.1 KTSC domain-containing protein [Salinivibrio proteolyticus]
MLDVRFKYGGGYRYYDVPEYIGNAFINASSHGTYFNDFIKDQYDYEKIEG